MTFEEKLQLIEHVLKVELNTLTESTKLADVAEWDSLNILNLLIEFSVLRPDLLFDHLYTCKTVGELCEMI